MKKDLPENIVQHITVAVVLESETPEAKVWNVYLINQKSQAIDTVMVSSKGYGTYEGREVQTSTLRHFIGNMDANTFVKVEAIDDRIFGLTNEYWLSFYIDQVIYDKKYIFLPESVVEGNLIRVPLVNKLGVIIGGTD